MMTARFLQFTGKLNGLSSVIFSTKIVPKKSFQLTFNKEYHATPTVLRKSGSKALEPKFRPPSKKQAKRKARQLQRDAKVVDHKKERLKVQHAKDQFNSQEMKEFIEDLRGRLEQPLSEMMLPDGLAVRKETTSLLPDIDPTKTMLKLAAIIDKKVESSGAIQLVDDALSKDANLSLLKYAQTEDIQGAMHMYNVMNELSIPLEVSTIAPLIKAATIARDFLTAETIFTSALQNDNIDVSISMWEAKIHNLAHMGDPIGAEKVLNNIISLKLLPTPAMYSAVLGSYVKLKQHSQAYNIWERMHVEAVDIDIAGFNHIFRYCAQNGMAERAFFFMDEMTKCYGLEPSRTTFKAFIEAAGTAPHFIPGFQDTLFDAIALLEGKEIVPDAGIYEAVISGFSKARDPVAAEYYFWEMKRKGIAPTSTAYANLLESYYNAQSVGASRYSNLGRYSKPAAKPPTPDQQDLIDLGPIKVAKILNSGVYTDYDYDKTSTGKRVKSPKYLDIAEDVDEEEREELFMEEVRRQAAELRAQNAAVTAMKEKRQQAEIEAAKQLQSGKSSRGGVLRLESGNNDGTNKEINLNELDIEALAGDDEGFLDMLKMLKNDPDALDGIEIDGMTFRASPKSTIGKTDPNNHIEELPKATVDQKAQLEFARARFKDVTMEVFEDPFSHMSDLQGKLRRPETLLEREERLGEEETARRLESISMLDFVLNDSITPSGVNSRRPIRSQGSAVNDIVDTASSISPNSTTIVEYDDEGNRLTPITDSEIHEGFDMVYFGRAPDADYSEPLNERRKTNIRRAELAFQHMINSGIKPTPRTLLMLLGVYSEAGRSEGVDKVLHMFDQHNIVPNNVVFRLIVKMHVRNKQLDRAIDVHQQMIQHQIIPDSETYGLLIETHIHHEKILESIKLFEEAVANKVKIPERHLRFLRARCTTLGIRHPDLPADPNQWVKDVKQTRRRMKQSSQRVIETMRSLTFN